MSVPPGLPTRPRKRRRGHDPASSAIRRPGSRSPSCCSWSCWARSCGTASPACSTSARPPSPRRWPMPSGCATRRSRPSSDAERTLAQATAEAEGIIAARRARKSSACRPAPRPACETPSRCASSRRSTASPSRRPPPPSRCATPPSTWRSRATRALLREQVGSGKSQDLVDQAIAELPRRLH